MMSFFKNKKMNLQKLISYGFIKSENTYTYSRVLNCLGMRIFIEIADSEDITVKVYDLQTEDEYVLHKIPDAKGEFVGRIRSEIDSLLCEISDQCFDSDAFSVPLTQRVIDYVNREYSDNLEFLWDTSPDCAIFRRADSGKWYGVIMKVPRSKFGFDSNDACEIINLHATPERVEALVDRKHIFPGFHMNKKYWISVLLENDIPFEVIEKLISDSYILAKKK